jgi:spore maturation protein CgeB
MNRILVIGSAHPAALEHIYVKHLQQLGNIVELYPIQDYFLQYYSKSIFNKILFRLGLSSIYKKLNRAVNSFVISFKPTHIIVFKGMEVRPATLLQWKNAKIKLINYNPDNPFIFSGRGSGNTNVSKAIALYDLYCSYDKDIILQLKQMGVNAALVPFGFELTEQMYHDLIQEPEVTRLCFLGNPDKARAKFIRTLLLAQIPIDIYGSGWDRYFSMDNPLLTIHKAVYGIDFWKVLRTYTVQLNLMRVHNLNSHNMRSFDIPGVGGIMLAPHTLDHITYFDVDKEIFVFKNIDDCIAQVKTLLNFDAKHRNKIREAARVKSLNNYTYYHQVTVFNSLLNGL